MNVSSYYTIYNERVGMCSHKPFPLLSPMAAQTAILPDLTDDDKASIFQSLDAILNSGILYSLLHGGKQHSVSRHVSAN